MRWGNKRFGSARQTLALLYLLINFMLKLTSLSSSTLQSFPDPMRPSGPGRTGSERKAGLEVRERRGKGPLAGSCRHSGAGGAFLLLFSFLNTSSIFFPSSQHTWRLNAPLQSQYSHICSFSSLFRPKIQTPKERSVRVLGAYMTKVIVKQVKCEGSLRKKCEYSG